MAVDKKYQSDVDMILSHRYDNGADYWTTPDKRLGKGEPSELATKRYHEILSNVKDK